MTFQVKQARSKTIVYPCMLSYYMCPYYDCIFRGRVCTQRKPIVYDPCIRSRHAMFVLLRIAPYTVTKIYNRNTDARSTAEKNGRIPSQKNRRRPFTTLYGIRNLCRRMSRNIIEKIIFILICIHV